MNKYNGDNMKNLLNLFNQERLNPKDFANAFKSVISYVQSAEQSVVKHLTTFTISATNAIQKLKTDTTVQISNFKEDVVGSIDKRFKEIDKNQTKAIARFYTALAKIKDGDPGKDADETAIEERIIARFPAITQPDLPEDVRNKLETLKGDDRLDVSAIRGLDNLKKSGNAHTVIPTNQGTGIADSTGHIDRFQWLKFPGATITRTNDEATITITSGGGFTTLTPTEVPNGTITVFTFPGATAQPSLINRDGTLTPAVAQSGAVYWTWNNATKKATMTLPPSDILLAVV